MTVVYRLVRAERANTVLSGEGARLYGGRWNPPGRPVVYASTSRALAVLEALVHVANEARFMRFLLYTLVLPRRARVQHHDGVRAPLALESSQEVGRTWLETGATLALVVPSVVVPQEVNYVLNVSHPQFARVELSAPESFSFDQRLWRTRFA